MAKPFKCMLRNCGIELSPNARVPLCPKHQSRYRYWGIKTWAERDARDEYLMAAHELLGYVKDHPVAKAKPKRKKETQVRSTRATSAAKIIVAA